MLLPNELELKRRKGIKVGIMHSIEFKAPVELSYKNVHQVVADLGIWDLRITSKP